MKARIQNAFLALVLFAGVTPALAQLTNLGIAPAGNQIVLFWPITATNYVLQCTTNLVSPNWSPVSDSVLVTAVAVTNTSPMMFFRLFLNTNAPPAGMVLIPAGQFTMGDALDDESDAYPVPVYVSSFYMDSNLVSASQWETVYGYAMGHGYTFDTAGLDNALNQPIIFVNWYDTVKWCNARSQQSGLTPVYYTDTSLTQIYTNGDTDAVYPNWAADGYRLPTEAEWEKAARGGLSGQRFPWGDVISETNANYHSGGGNYDLGPNGYNTNFDINMNAIAYTSPVGYFAPNSYGLYDMAGNVEEWCWDWYETYAGGNDPHGPASGSMRIMRGGSWNDYADYARCANRVPGSPSDNYVTIGFRCVRGF